LRTGRGRATVRDQQRALLMAASAEAERKPAPRRARERLAEAFGWRGPDPVVTGAAAKVRWWQRLRAAVLLLVLLVILGVALAAAIGAIVFLAGFFLELATR
jgi:hypothetical protein